MSAPQFRPQVARNSLGKKTENGLFPAAVFALLFPLLNGAGFSGPAIQILFLPLTGNITAEKSFREST